MKIEKKIALALTDFVDVFNDPENLENAHRALLDMQKDCMSNDQRELISSLVMASISMGFVITPSAHYVDEWIDHLLD